MYFSYGKNIFVTSFPSHKIKKIISFSIVSFSFFFSLVFASSLYAFTLELRCLRSALMQREIYTSIRYRVHFLRKYKEISVA